MHITQSLVAPSPSQTGLLRTSGCWSHFSALPPGRWLYCGEKHSHLLDVRVTCKGIFVLKFVCSVVLPFCKLGPLFSSLQFSLQDH